MITAPGLRSHAPVGLVLACFFLQPVAFGAWLPRIPEVQRALTLSPSELSLCLLGMPIGILLTLPFGGRLVAALGVRRMMVLGFIAFLGLVPLPAFAPAPIVLFLTLLMAGSAMSVLELALNISADLTEKQAGRPIMNTAHGFWSLGIMTGSLVGAGLAWANVPPHLAVGGIAAVTLPLALLVCAALPMLEKAGQDQTEERDSPPLFALPGPAVALIGLFVIGIGMTEGAVADWSAIYLRDVFDLAKGPAGLGYAIFAGLLTLGRLIGDRLKTRLGPVRLARLCLAFALAGLGLVVLSPLPAFALVGFGAVGFGVSVGFPLAVTAAADAPEQTPAANVAALTLMSLLGFMIGPVMIGALIEWGGPRAGLAALLPLLLLSLAMTGRLNPDLPPIASRAAGS